jgi:Uncharacterized protein containing a von Willebrand factor type A (vWA) domain
MQFRIKYIILTLLFTLTTCIGIGQIARAQKEEEKALAVILVIDTSQSMQTTDPNHYREGAMNILLNLLSNEDYFGVLTFDTNVTIAQPLIKLGNNDNRNTIKTNLHPSYLTVGDTDYKKALEEAAKQLDLIQADNIEKAIFFITDGDADPDPSKNGEAGFMEHYMNSLWETVGQLSEKDDPVYSIGFSNNIKTDILEKISKTTGGSFWLLKDAKSLNISLSNALTTLKDSSSIQIQNKSEMNHQHKEDSGNNDLDRSQNLGMVAKEQKNPTVFMMVCFILLILIIVLFIITVILNIIDFKKKELRYGKLLYCKIEGDEPIVTYEFYNKKKGSKKTLIVSFNNKNSDADLNISGTRFDYDLILSRYKKKGKISLFHGWKSIFYKDNPSAYLIQTTKPGVIEKENKIDTEIVIESGEEFITGGYLFCFEMPIPSRYKN